MIMLNYISKIKKNKTLPKLYSSIFFKNKQIRLNLDKSNTKATKVRKVVISKPKLNSKLVYLPGAVNSLILPKYKRNTNAIDHNMAGFIKSTTMRLREYLLDTKGVFNKSTYSSILVPKSSTKKLPSGVAKDQRRSVLSKISNYFTNSGLNLTSIIHLNKAFILLNKLAKADVKSDNYVKFSLVYDNAGLLNAAYKSSNLPIINNLIEGSNQAIPRFFIKKHKSKLPGRKKNKTKGKPPVRSYLAFIKPHGRSLIALKWLVSELEKMPQNTKLYEKYAHLMIANVVKADSKLYRLKKISIYKSIVDYLKRKGT